MARNAGGAFGAWLADLLLYVFGVSAYWWTAACLYVVVWGYRRMEPVRLALGVGRLPAAARFELRARAPAPAQPVAPSCRSRRAAWSATTVAGALSTALGFTGATLALLTLAAIGFSLFIGVSWLTIFEAVGGFLEKGYGLALGAWERRRDRKLGSRARVEREAVVEVEKQREEEHPPLRIEPPLAEIKKSGACRRRSRRRCSRTCPTRRCRRSSCSTRRRRAARASRPRRWNSPRA